MCGTGETYGGTGGEGRMGRMIYAKIDWVKWYPQLYVNSI